MTDEVLICSECQARSDDESEDAPLVFSCNRCGAITCDNCGSGGMCTDCDVDTMAGIDDDEDEDDDYEDEDEDLEDDG